MNKKQIKNIYRIYQYDTLKFNFFIKKFNWVSIVAKVKIIEGVIEGEKLNGPYPYYNNPKVIVDLYEIINGDILGNYFIYPNLKIQKIKQNQLIETAGSYSWVLIDKINFIEN